MKKLTIKALSKGLQQEFRPPEDLPFPLRKALKALADLPAEPDEKCPADELRKISK
jgi:hypothetical protein